MPDQRGRLLRAAVGFAGCSMPLYHGALLALRAWLDSWAGIGHVAVGMHRHGFDLQLTQYDDRGWRATFYTAGMEHSADERDRHRVGCCTCDEVGGVGGVEKGGELSRTRNPSESLVLPKDETLLVQMNRSPIIRANQAHPVSGRDREAATIAGLPEAGSVPQLNRTITREAALFNSISNELSSNIWSHASSGSTYRPIQSISTSL